MTTHQFLSQWSHNVLYTNIIDPVAQWDFTHTQSNQVLSEYFRINNGLVLKEPCGIHNLKWNEDSNIVSPILRLNCWQLWYSVSVHSGNSSIEWEITPFVRVSFSKCCKSLVNTKHQPRYDTFFRNVMLTTHLLCL